MKTIGIRELRQAASQIIEAARGGAIYRVTNHGKDTGVQIGRHTPLGAVTGLERHRGASPDQVISSGVYDTPKPVGYEEEMLRIVERGRNRSGHVGE